MADYDPTETIPPLPFMREERLSPGTVVGGRYEVMGFLGYGGHSNVYRVLDQEVKREIALKILRPGRETASAAARLLREVRVARDVVSPCLVRIYDIGVSPEGTYLTMELVEGPPLRKLLERGPLPLEDAIRIAIEIFEGLEALHALQIVHRDVKPGNILLTPGHEVKLADFGLARRLGREETQITRAEGVVGTLDYLSPEQARGAEVGPESDLYSVGVVLFEILTGELPYTRSSDLGALLAHLHATPKDVRELRPEIPEWLAGIVRRLLEKRPEDRYPSAEAVVLDLKAQRAPAWGGRARRRFTWAACAFLTLGLLGAGAMTCQRAPKFHHLLPVEPDEIRAVDDQGGVIWKKTRVSPEEAYHSGLVRLEPGGKPVLGIVLHSPHRWAPEEAETLTFLDPATGGVVREVRLPSDAKRFPSFANRFHPYAFLARDLDQDGVDEVILTYIHSPEWPSYTVLYEPRLGRGRVVFFGSGHHRIVGAEDVDGDGREELLLAGINNVFGWYNVLAAVRPDPWIGEGASGSWESAASPDVILTERQRAALAWYALLPRGELLNAKGELTTDRARRRLTLRYRSGKEAAVSFDGFLLSAPSSLPLVRRQEARGEAFRYLREAIRLAAIRDLEAAIEESEKAIALAREAGDPILEECLTRFEGKYLVADGRLREAEALFVRLSEASENASEIAFDAGEVFHLKGHLEEAAHWYRRGLGNGGSGEQGKTKFEFVKGEVLALVELGRFDEAIAAIDDFKAAYPNVTSVEALREYVRWRRGEAPHLEGLGIDHQSIDLLQYWQLEFEHARGDDPETLLGRVEKEVAYGSEMQAGFLSLKGELLYELGRKGEARESAERALEIARAERTTKTTTRAHFDLISQRFEKLKE